MIIYNIYVGLLNLYSSLYSGSILKMWKFDNNWYKLQSIEWKNLPSETVGYAVWMSLKSSKVFLCILKHLNLSYHGNKISFFKVNIYFFQFLIKQLELFFTTRFFFISYEKIIINKWIVLDFFSKFNSIV